MDKYYAIVITGRGRRTRYRVRLVESLPGLTWTYPVFRKSFRTELDARDAAARMGIEITRAGRAEQVA